MRCRVRPAALLEQLRLPVPHRSRPRRAGGGGTRLGRDRSRLGGGDPSRPRPVGGRGPVSAETAACDGAPVSGVTGYCGGRPVSGETGACSGPVSAETGALQRCWVGCRPNVPRACDDPLSLAPLPGSSWEFPSVEEEPQGSGAVGGLHHEASGGTSSADAGHEGQLDGALLAGG